jgi:hypothetical protein
LPDRVGEAGAAPITVGRARRGVRLCPRGRGAKAPELRFPVLRHGPVVSERPAGELIASLERRSRCRARRVRRRPVSDVAQGPGAFKRFQITDEFCEKFGYSKITKEDKAKIFGLNAAQIYGVNVKEKRNPLSPDIIAQARKSYENAGLLRENAAYGWVRADD